MFIINSQFPVHGLHASPSTQGVVHRSGNITSIVKKAERLPQMNFTIISLDRAELNVLIAVAFTSPDSETVTEENTVLS